MSWDPDEDEEDWEWHDDVDEEAPDKGGILQSMRLWAMIGLSLVALIMVGSLLVRLVKALAEAGP